MFPIFLIFPLIFSKKIKNAFFGSQKNKIKISNHSTDDVYCPCKISARYHVYIIRKKFDKIFPPAQNMSIHCCNLGKSCQDYIKGMMVERPSPRPVRQPCAPGAWSSAHAARPMSRSPGSMASLLRPPAAVLATPVRRSGRPSVGKFCGFLLVVIVCWLDFFARLVPCQGPSLLHTMHTYQAAWSVLV